MSVVGRRSGDRIALGDRVTLVIEDVALLRRTIYGRRVPPAHAFEHGESEDAIVAPALLETRTPRRKGRRGPDTLPPNDAATGAGARRRGKVQSVPPREPPFARGKRGPERPRSFGSFDEEGRRDKRGARRQSGGKRDKRRR